MRRPRTSLCASACTLVVIGLVLVACLLVALSFLGYQETSRQLSGLNLRESVKTAITFLAGGFGPAAEYFWPSSGIIVILLMSFAIGILVVGLFIGRTSCKFHVFAFASFFLAIACLSMSFGLGRRSYGFVSRYFLMAAPALCLIYYVFVYHRSRFGSYLQNFMLISIAFAGIVNFERGVRYGQDYESSMKSFILDMVAGHTPSQLLARHAPSLYPCPFGREPSWGIQIAQHSHQSSSPMFPPQMTCVSFHGWLERSFKAMHNSGIGVFRDLRVEPYAVREVSFREMPRASSQANKGVLEAQEGENSSNLIVSLEAPRFVRGLRITYRGSLQPDGARRPPCLQVFWKRDGQQEFSGDQRYIHYVMAREEQVTIWIEHSIHEVAFNLDDRVDVQDILELTFLLPAELSNP
jgi:ABC-type cobalt transport system substrate-binding protein